MRARLPACVVALALAAVGSSPAAASPSQNPQASLELGRLAYQRSEFGEVEKAIHPLLYPTVELTSHDDVVGARRLLLLSYFFQDKKPEARREVVSLLALEPGYQLDPAVDPPVAVRFFEEVRVEQGKRMLEIRRRQIEEAERARKEEERRRAAERAKAERIIVEKQVIRRSRLIAMLPFGAGQAQNGQRGKAIAFGLTELALGGLSLGTWIAVDQRYGNGLVPKADKPLADTLLGLQIGAGAAFWVVVAWGIIDAQVKLKSETVITRELDKPVPPHKVKSQIMITPTVAPGLYGLGVGGTF